MKKILVWPGLAGGAFLLAVCAFFLVEAPDYTGIWDEFWYFSVVMVIGIPGLASIWGALVAHRHPVGGGALQLVAGLPLGLFALVALVREVTQSRNPGNMLLLFAWFLACMLITYGGLSAMYIRKLPGLHE